MEPKYLSEEVTIHLYTPIIIWQGDWIPRDSYHSIESSESILSVEPSNLDLLARCMEKGPNILFQMVVSDGTIRDNSTPEKQIQVIHHSGHPPSWWLFWLLKPLISWEKPNGKLWLTCLQHFHLWSGGGFLPSIRIPKDPLMEGRGERTSRTQGSCVSQNSYFLRGQGS